MRQTEQMQLALRTLTPLYQLEKQDYGKDQQPLSVDRCILTGRNWEEDRHKSKIFFVISIDETLLE